jgi:hypothetical protein
MLCTGMILHCFAYVLQKTAVANVQPESARGGPQVLGRGGGSRTEMFSGGGRNGSSKINC